MIFEAMIVDDEAPARVELINQLERTGRVTVVNEAVCLQEGIAKMQSQRIDVVFIDHNIAGSGTMLLPAALKDMDYTPALIYMTAYSDVNDEPFGVDPHVDELAVDLELGVIRADGLDHALRERGHVVRIDRIEELVLERARARVEHEDDRDHDVVELIESVEAQVTDCFTKEVFAFCYLCRSVFLFCDHQVVSSPLRHF